MKKLENNWIELRQIVLNIFSAEYIFSKEKNKILLNCGFENLKKGRCNVHFDKKISSSQENCISIHSDQPLMTLHIYDDFKNIEKVSSWLRSSTGRKNKLIVFLSEGLQVDSEGYLYIKESIEVIVEKIEWSIPLI